MGEGRDNAPAGLYRRAANALSRYVDNPDPLVRACNVIALLVVSNQPFYPFYVRYLAADDGGLSFLTLLSTPMFAAIPLIARYFPVAGIAALPVTGLLNGMLATWALGSRAGVELFVVPCIAIAILAASRKSAPLVLGATLAALGAYALVFGLYGDGLKSFHGSRK